MGTHYRGSRHEINVLNAYIKLMRAANSITGRLAKGLKPTSLTMTQFSILETLYHLGPMNQRTLGAKVLKSSGNITLVVDNLEKSGLVRRVRSRSDRRFITVSLTKKGKETISEIFPDYLFLIVNEMEVIDDNELKTLENLCKILGLHKRENDKLILEKSY